MNRLEACRICLDGAPNPYRIATALAEAIMECTNEKVDPKTDPLVHGILSQLTNVLGCGSTLPHSDPEIFSNAYDMCFVQEWMK